MAIAGTSCYKHFESVACINIDVARGLQGMQVQPQGDGKKFSRHFCWNEVKMGLNLAVYDVYDHVREGDD